MPLFVPPSPPALVVPAVGIAPNLTTASTWYAANAGLAMRFWLPSATPLRYACFYIGIQSGNIQVCVLQLSGANRLSYTRVKDSGIFACPAAGWIRKDLGAFTLAPGDYALAFWADNTTVTTPNSASTPTRAAKAVMTDPLSAAGWPGSGTFADGFSTRYMGSFTLEADV